MVTEDKTNLESTNNLGRLFVRAGWIANGMNSLLFCFVMNGERLLRKGSLRESPEDWPLYGLIFSLLSLAFGIASIASRRWAQGFCIILVGSLIPAIIPLLWLLPKLLVSFG